MKKAQKFKIERKWQAIKVVQRLSGLQCRIEPRKHSISPDLCLLVPGGQSLFQVIIVSSRVTIATFVHALVDSPCFHLPYCVLFGYPYSAERAVHGDSPANSLPVSQNVCVKGQMCPPIVAMYHIGPIWGREGGQRAKWGRRNGKGVRRESKEGEGERGRGGGAKRGGSEERTGR